MPTFPCRVCGRAVEVEHNPESEHVYCPACAVLDPGGTAAAWPVTAAGEEASGTAPTGLIYVPGYEVLEELGRGGMGVVYKARQVALNRVVALKMILAGGHASDDHRVRFKAEAEAIARLQHSNIVQIHEVGEHGGLPFFSLEFCPGGSLKGKLGGTPLPPREAAEVVRRLADGMHAAHLAGVVHRDLNPANVLLSADGTPKVTDFGLVKTLDETALTATGAVLGTPPYMAPEQAAGKSNEVGPTADVYALGAILYECLTGRPPFKAATPMDTILQVLHDEPAPPRRLNPTVPRDLETVCLKCLQKEPGKRYLRAAELVEDLGRYLAGQPVKARPVGVLERAAKWARRRPAASALVAVSVLAGLALLGGGGWFTWELDKARRLADDRAVKAAEKEEEAKQALEQVEETLAVGLLRPLAPKGRSVGDVEMAALWELASLPRERDRVRLLFLERALDRPGTAVQLKNRLPLALHAAIGLDRRRADAAADMLLRQLERPGADRQIRLTCALAAVELGVGEPRLTELVLANIEQSMEATKDPWEIKVLAEGLVRLSPRPGGARAARLYAEAARHVVEAIEPKADPYVIRALAKALDALTDSLDPTEAAKLHTRAAHDVDRAAGKRGKRFTSWPRRWMR